MSRLAAVVVLAVVAASAGLEAPAPIPGYHAEWALQSAYVDAVAGERTELVMAYWNRGSEGWYRDLLGASPVLALSDPYGDARWSPWRTPEWASARVVARLTTEYVGPGQLGWFRTSFVVPADAAAGIYRIDVRPLVGEAGWLEDYGAFHQIRVPAAGRFFTDEHGIVASGSYLGEARTGLMRLTPFGGGPLIDVAFDVRSDGTYVVAIGYGDVSGAVPPDLYLVSMVIGDLAFVPARAGEPPIGGITWPPPTPTATPRPTAPTTPAPTATTTPAPTAEPTPTPTPTAESTPTATPAVAPTSSVIDGPSSPTKKKSWTFAASATDDVMLASITLYVRVPGSGSYSAVSSQTVTGTTAGVTFDYKAEGAGTYEVYTRATDAEGNVEAAPALPDWTVELQ